MKPPVSWFRHPLVTAAWLLAALTLPIAPLAQATTPACGATLTKNTQLDAGMSCPDIALRLSGSESKGVTLNCAGHRITSADGAAIIASGASGITIKNCDISTSAAFAQAILFEDTQNSLIKNNNITTAGVGARGIELRASSNNEINGNEVHTVGARGADALRVGASSDNNLIRDNDLQAAASYPVSVESSAANSIRDNSLVSPLGYVTVRAFEFQEGGLGIDSSGNIYGVENDRGSSSGLGRATSMFILDPVAGRPTWYDRLIYSNFSPIGFGFDALDILPNGKILALPGCCQSPPSIYQIQGNKVSRITLHIVSGSGQMNGLEAVSDNSLLATSAAGELLSIDLPSYEVTLIGQQAVGWADLAMHPTDGRLFTVSRRENEASNTAHLYEIDPATGDILSEIGDTGEVVLADIDFALDGTLYGNNGSLIIIDTADASVTQAGNASFGPDPRELWPRINRLQGNRFQTADGSLQFPDDIVLQVALENDISSARVEIGPNRVSVDSANLPFLDEPARIWLNNLPGSARNLLVDPQDDGSFEPCEPPRCKFVRFKDGTLVFDVKGFTTYSSTEQTGPLQTAAEMTQDQVKTLLTDPGISNGIRKKLKAAFKRIDTALRFAKQENLKKAFAALSNATLSLAKAASRLAAAGELIDELVDGTNAEAQAAIDRASATGGASDFVTAARAHMVTAQSLQDQGKPEKAILAYGKAWNSARKGTLYQVGGRLQGLTGGSLVLRQVGGDDLELAADGPFSFAKLLANGDEYLVTVLTEPYSPHHDCKVRKGKGLVDNGDITNILVECTVVPASFVYVGNTYADSVTAFSMNPGNGALTEIFPADISDWGASSVTVDSTGRFVYQANDLSGINSVISLVIDAETGALTTTGMIANGGYAQSMAVDPRGRYAYVPHISNIIYRFTIDQASGTLTEPSPQIATQYNLGRALAIDPGGRFAFMATYTRPYFVSAYSIDPGTGTLTEVGDHLPVGEMPYSVSVHPTGRFAYVASSGSSDVTAFAIDMESGALSEAGSAITVDAGARSVIIDPAGRFAYVLSGYQNDGTITIFGIDPVTGSLNLAGVEVNDDLFPTSIAIDASGRIAYVTNGYRSRNNLPAPVEFDVIAYSIDPDSGLLTELGTYDAMSLFDPTGVYQDTQPNPAAIVLSPPKRFAYVANADSDDISIYGIDPGTGELSALGSVATGAGPFAVTVGPGGRFAYATNAADNTVSAYAIHPQNGMLTATGPAVATGSSPLAVSVDPSGRFAYATNVGSNDITSFRIDPDTGALTEVGAAAATGEEPNSIVVEPTGRFAYVANMGSNDVTSFSIDPASGALTEVGTEIEAGTEPYAVTVHPSGRFAYVVNQESDDVTSFSIDLASGALTEVGTEVAAGNAPKAMTIHPSGRFAYVTNEVSDDVTTFSIDPVSGALAEVGTEVEAGNGPRAISVDPTGRFAYVANVASNDVTRYSIDPVSGALTELGTEIAAGTGPQSIAIVGGSH